MHGWLGKTSIKAIKARGKLAIKESQKRSEVGMAMGCQWGRVPAGALGAGAGGIISIPPA